MTLHDRIMIMDVGTLSGDNSFHEGVTAAKFKAAMVATEADELMAEMADLIDHYKMLLQALGIKPKRTDAIIEKYNTYMERNNEQ